MENYNEELKSENKGNSNKKESLLLSIVGLIIIITVVAGVSYAAFTVTLKGSKINMIRTGKVTMNYTERNGINITDASPLTDNEGKKLYGENNTFNFNTGITVNGKTTVNYEITAEKDSNIMTAAKTDTCETVWEKAMPTSDEVASCTLIKDSEIKLYLVKKDAEGTLSYTDSNGNLPNGVEEVLAPSHFVTGTNNTLGNSQYGGSNDEMVLYRGSFVSPSNTEYTATDYFELRMWVDDTVYEIDGTQRQYAVKVNVYGTN